MDKALILLSGGLDSAVAAYLYHSRSYDICALTFSVESPRCNKAEVECSKLIASALNIEQTIIDLSFLNALLGDNGGVHDEIDRLKRKDVAVPFGVEIIHLASSIFALNRDIKIIVWGIQSGDYGGKENVVRAYLKIFGEFIRFRSKHKLDMETPFITMDKEDIVSLGSKLGVPFEHTISCLSASENAIHCGKCDSCKERIIAFKHLGLEDPVLWIRSF